jgi:hypothetical protein
LPNLLDRLPRNVCCLKEEEIGKQRFSSSSLMLDVVLVSGNTFSIFIVERTKTIEFPEIDQLLFFELLFRQKL